MTRRWFLQLCATLAALLAMPPVLHRIVAEAQLDDDGFGFPLSFPVFFDDEPGVMQDKKVYRCWLPAIRSD